MLEIVLAIAALITIVGAMVSAVAHEPVEGSPREQDIGHLERCLRLSPNANRYI